MGRFVHATGRDEVGFSKAGDVGDVDASDGVISVLKGAWTGRNKPFVGIGSGEVVEGLYYDGEYHALAGSVEYELDPKEQVEVLHKADQAGLDVLGFYHSHTFSEAYPSITDISKMSDWGYYYLIASLANNAAPVVRAFWFLGREIEDTESRVEEVRVKPS